MKQLSRTQKRTLQDIFLDKLPIGARHRTVKKLAEWGYIQLKRSIVDDRIINYKPTDKGLEWLRNLT